MLFHLFIFQRLQIALALLACALFFYSFWKKNSYVYLFQIILETIWLPILIREILLLISLCSLAT